MNVVVDELAPLVQLLLRETLDARHLPPMKTRGIEDIVDGPGRDRQAQLVANLMASAKILRPPLFHERNDISLLFVCQ